MPAAAVARATANVDTTRAPMASTAVTTVAAVAAAATAAAAVTAVATAAAAATASVAAVAAAAAAAVMVAMTAVANAAAAAAAATVTSVAIHTGEAGSITALGGCGCKPRLHGPDLVDLIACDVGTELGQFRVDSCSKRGQDVTHVDGSSVVRDLR